MSTATAPHATHLHWSRWFHCESSFSLSLVPNKPGIFAIAESPCGDEAVPRPAGLILNIIQVDSAADLFHALNSLYSHESPIRERLQKNRCFIRYAPIDDTGLRHAVAADLKQWLDSTGETDSPFVKDFQRAADPEKGPYRTKGD